MASVIRMPSVLAGAEEGAIAAWLVAEGDEVAVGDAIVEIETDKATVEYEAEAAGTLGRILVPAGVAASVGDPIAVLVDAGEDVARAAQELGLTSAAGAGGEPDALPAAVSDESPSAPVPAAQEPATQEPAAQEPAAREPAAQERATREATAQEPTARNTGARLFASPIARKIAQKNGVELATLAGTGPEGRVTRRDVEAALRRAPATQAASTSAEPASTPPAAAATRADTSVDTDAVLVPHSPMRRAIARRLTESQATIPQFQVVAECVVDDLLALRTQVNATLAGQKLSVNDFVVKAVAGALSDVPEANVTWTDEGMLQHSRADVAVAVSTDGGLVTPVVRDVGSRSVSAVGAAVADLAERARAKRLTQTEIEGGTFTVSNLGMFGTVGFSAIVNPPHWGILAVGAARQQPVVVDGALAVATVMRCTLTVDHRAVDGALAAQWLAAFQRRIEEPLLILV
ncbi:dihydrolipoamide acetyltransferase family protein [Microbacterium terrisoli]|uniref:dihydrolipoamide acetyltransferase family protein n=1 Tax=Microbacterium terrisoli TaxID=3242192 RepID=UPI0028043AB2|nr:dihydrolipoamide acetyltransferase family protein [Microbacterium protaetiae]